MQYHWTSSRKLRVYATQKRGDRGFYRIPIGIQFLWAIILAFGLFLLREFDISIVNPLCGTDLGPADSPRFYVKMDKLERAMAALSRIRGQAVDSEYIRDELAEIVAN